MGAEYIAPTVIRSPASPALSKLLYRLSYRGPPRILSVFKNLSATGSFRITINLPFSEIRLTKTRHVESTRFKGSFITLSYNARLLRNPSARPWIQHDMLVKIRKHVARNMLNWSWRSIKLLLLHLVGVPYYFTYNDDARSITNQIRKHLLISV
jgi:hypothetical protein